MRGGCGAGKGATWRGAAWRGGALDIRGPGSVCQLALSVASRSRKWIERGPRPDRTGLGPRCEYRSDATWRCGEECRGVARRGVGGRSGVGMAL